jgi:hypothetical protein
MVRNNRRGRLAKPVKSRQPSFTLRQDELLAGDRRVTDSIPNRCSSALGPLTVAGIGKLDQAASGSWRAQSSSGSRWQSNFSAGAQGAQYSGGGFLSFLGSFAHLEPNGGSGGGGGRESSGRPPICDLFGNLWRFHGILGKNHCHRLRRPFAWQPTEKESGS